MYVCCICPIEDICVASLTEDNNSSVQNMTEYTSR